MKSPLEQAKEIHKCEAKKFHDYHFYPCENKSKINIEGKWYCGIHNPIKIKKKLEEKQKEWEEEFRRNNERLEYQNLAINYFKRKNITLESLREISQKELGLSADTKQ